MSEALDAFTYTLTLDGDLLVAGDAASWEIPRRVLAGLVLFLARRDVAARVQEIELEQEDA